MSQRQPGHRQGVRRYQRYGQTALDVGRTLDFSLDEEGEADAHAILPSIGTCQSCGAYWDLRHRERCPNPCGGYIG